MRGAHLDTRNGAETRQNASQNSLLIKASQKVHTRLSYETTKHADETAESHTDAPEVAAAS